MNGEGEEARVPPKDSNEALARIVYALEDIAEDLDDIAEVANAVDEVLASFPDTERNTVAGFIRQYKLLVAEEPENEPGT